MHLLRAKSCREVFDQTGELRDLLDAIGQQQRALALFPSDYAAWPDVVHDLGNLFDRRFQISNDVDDIYKATDHLQQAVDLIAKNNINRPTYLNELGCSLAACFERAGEPDVIPRAVQAKEPMWKRCGRPPKL